MRAFAQADRFVSELESRKLRPAYVFVGDEAFFRKRFRDAILEHLVPADLRDFSLFEFDLAENDLAEVLDRARTPSLMAPFQVFFVRGVKNLFGRGSNEEKLAAIEDLLQKSESRRADRFRRRPYQHSSRRSPHGDARQRTLPAHPRNHGPLLRHCGTGARGRRRSRAVDFGYCSSRGEPVKIDPDGARELVDALGGDMMMISNELEKLMLYVGAKIASRWAMSKPWCWPPSNARFMN